jgi:hypothetical protein
MRPRPYDAGKKVKGRMRQILVEMDGCGGAFERLPAYVKGKDGAPFILLLSQCLFPFITKAFAGPGLPLIRSHTSTLGRVG